MKVVANSTVLVPGRGVVATRAYDRAMAIRSCAVNEGDEHTRLLRQLESLRWPSGSAQCPYCTSDRSTRSRSEARYHCNYCNTSFSVFTGTPLHGTKVPLQKWLAVTDLLLSGTDRRDASSRKVASALSVHKDTACRMLRTIGIARHDHPIFISQLATLIIKDSQGCVQ